MAKRNIGSVAELKALVGQEVAVSDWLAVTQDMIDRFADATGDHQWIHVDPERAKKESPYGATIAHGFLTASLLPQLRASAIELPPGRMGVNYGFNKVRFSGPVPSGSRIRGRFTLASVEDLKGGCQMQWDVSVEREGEDKPVLVAQWLSRRYD